MMLQITLKPDASWAERLEMLAAQGSGDAPEAVSEAVGHGSGPDDKVWWTPAGGLQDLVTSQFQKKLR